MFILSITLNAVVRFGDDVPRCGYRAVNFLVLTNLKAFLHLVLKLHVVLRRKTKAGPV